MRFTVKAWSPTGHRETKGHQTFCVNAPDIKTAMNVARARVPKGEVSVQPYRKDKA